MFIPDNTDTQNLPDGQVPDIEDDEWWPDDADAEDIDDED